MCLIVHVSEGFPCVHGGAEDESQDAGSLVVEGLLADLDTAEHLQVVIGQVAVLCPEVLLTDALVRPLVGTHLYVESVHGCLAGVVGTCPVADHHTVESPFALEYAVQGEVVVAGVCAQYLVIGAHDAPCATLLHGGTEGREVYLAHGPLADAHIDVPALLLLIVQRVVLHTGGYAILLQLLHVGHHHAASQVGVFPHVLEVAPVQWGTVDVHTGSQQDVLLAEACLLAHGLAIEGSHLGVPCGSQAGQCREGRTRVVRPCGIAPRAPLYLLAHTVGSVAHPQFGYAQAWHTGTAELALRMTHGHLLLQRHAAEGVLHSLFNGLGLVQIDGRLCQGTHTDGQGTQGNDCFFHVLYIYKCIVFYNVCLTYQVTPSASLVPLRQGDSFG